MNIKISRVLHMGQAFMNDKAKEYGLTSGLFYYILELSEKDGLTLQELSQAIGVDNGHTTRVIKKLVELDYVVKTPNKLDSRSSQVFLTDKGREVSKEIYNIFIGWKNIVTKDITEEELVAVNNVFDKFYDNANEALNGK